MTIRYLLSPASTGENQIPPEARTDGSGYVTHDIAAQEDSTGDWKNVPGYHKDIMVEADALAIVLAMANGAAKNTAYKDLLIASRDNVASPDTAPNATDWSKAGIETYITDYAAWLAGFNATNAATATVADDADTYITDTLELTYPIPFNI